MTLDEFQRMAGEGLAIECSDVSQRRNVIELFYELGYNINPASMEYLQLTDDVDDSFMHPCFRPCKDCVSCFRNIAGAMEFVAHTVSYDDVKTLIDNPQPVDERSDDEFADDFVALMSGWSLV